MDATVTNAITPAATMETVVQARPRTTSREGKEQRQQHPTEEVRAEIRELWRPLVVVDVIDPSAWKVLTSNVRAKSAQTVMFSSR
jgi:hypothetical protein